MIGREGRDLGRGRLNQDFGDRVVSRIGREGECASEARTDGDGDSVLGTGWSGGKGSLTQERWAETHRN